MTMIQKINDYIKNQKNGIINSENIFIADFKNTDGGEVKISNTQPTISSVKLKNINNVEIYFVAFMDNALKVDTEEGQVKQCECILFPSSCNTNDWVLFIETKYAANLKAAFDEKVDYPNTMINQIISTVNYFRNKGILPNDKKVNAILSFPPLLEIFSESFLTRSEKTPEEIFSEHKILIRATNEAEIISSKRIKL